MKRLSEVPSKAVEVGMYFAIDYITTFYFGRVVSVEADGFVQVKFLHSKTSTTFDWPTSDDADGVHLSCIFYGPVMVEGTLPFRFSKQAEVERVYLFL